MRAEPMYQIPEKGLTVWRIYGLIYSILIAIAAGFLCFFANKFEWPLYVVIITVACVVISVVMLIVLFPTIRWNIWRYEVREQEIEIRSGLFVVKHTLIPMVRVQHVDTEQGPILKRYNLANISISTAATTHTVPMLEVGEASELRMKISELARVAEEDV